MKKLTIVFMFFAIFIYPLKAQWTTLSTVSTNYPSNFIVNNDGDLYVTTNDGVYKSIDDGMSWNEITNNFINDPSNANRYIEFAGNNIYVATTTNGVYMSPDNGGTWQFDTTGLGSFNFGPEIDLLYSDGNNIFASYVGFIAKGFFRKSSGTGSWTKVVSGTLGDDYGSEVLGLTRIGSELFAATPSLGVFVSSDDGVSWTQKLNNNFPANATIFPFNCNRLISKGNTLYYKSHDGLFMSTDFGDNWSRIDQGFTASSIQCIYTDGSNIYASLWGNDNAYYSSDDGTTWQDISTGLPQWVVSFAMKGGTLFATTFGNPEVIVNNGIAEVELINSEIPTKFVLENNFPNPFNPSTTIKFSIPHTSYVTLEVFNAVGESVGLLVSQKLAPGIYNYQWDATSLTSGVYFYKLQTRSFIETKKMILLK